ncbi:MAG: MEKHLA domain-containing protein [Methylococcaceae bacterium]|nr:MEKHLA domain-containing protein [Methylococcaceae bacterium]
MDYPTEENNFLLAHVLLLNNSYRYWLSQDLMPPCTSAASFAKQLFYAPFALVSHNTALDPVFNYANLKALELFELGWDDFTRLPSRLSAETPNQAERERALAIVSRNGYLYPYEGVRIASSGKRFCIKNAVIWNLLDQHQQAQGQAAMLTEWTFL